MPKIIIYHSSTNISVVHGRHKYFEEPSILHCPHVVLGFQRQLQNFSSVNHSLMAGGGDGFAGDTVDLVESVRSHGPLISCTDEDLQSQSFSPTVSMQLHPE